MSSNPSVGYTSCCVYNTDLRCAGGGRRMKEQNRTGVGPSDMHPVESYSQGYLKPRLLGPQQVFQAKPWCFLYLNQVFFVPNFMPNPKESMTKALSQNERVKR